MGKRKYSRRRRRESFAFLYKLLAVLVICTAIVVALTLFFRVDEISITGQQRYSEDEIREASGVEIGDNLYLLSKPDIVKNILKELPYIKNIHINRKLPSTLCIEIQESGRPLAVVQDGIVWLVSAGGKIVDQAEESAAGSFAQITGCELLAPSVGTKVALATEYASQQSSLLALLEALEDAGILEQVDAIHLEDLSCINMDYAQRFTVRLGYGADYVWELTRLTKTLAREEIQSNMTGTIDLQLDEDYVHFIQNER